MFSYVLPEIILCACREMSTMWGNIAVIKPQVQHGDQIQAGAGKERSFSIAPFHKVEFLGCEVVLKYGGPHGVPGTIFPFLALGGGAGVPDRVQQK